MNVSYIHPHRIDTATPLSSGHPNHSSPPLQQQSLSTSPHGGRSICIHHFPLGGSLLRRRPRRPRVVYKLFGNRPFFTREKFAKCSSSPHHHSSRGNYMDTIDDDGRRTAPGMLVKFDTKAHYSKPKTCALFLAREIPPRPSSLMSPHHTTEHYTTYIIAHVTIL